MSRDPKDRAKRNNFLFVRSFFCLNKKGGVINKYQVNFTKYLKDNSKLIKEEIYQTQEGISEVICPVVKIGKVVPWGSNLAVVRKEIFNNLKLGDDIEVRKYGILKIESVSLQRHENEFFMKMKYYHKLRGGIRRRV